MTVKNIALSLALEAEAEAEVVADTYEGLAQVLDIENSLTDAKQANDVAIGLENLSIVLESLKELDATDVALIQVIGDIAGASSGMSGEVFTPAMEDMESDETSTEQKSNAIMEKIHEMIAYVIEKINAFIAWAMEKFRNGFKKLKEVAGNVKNIVGRPVEQYFIDIVRKRLGGMLQLSKAIDAYIPLVHDLALWRGEVSKADAGHADEGLPHELLRHMDEMYRGLEAYDKKYENQIRHTGIQIVAKTERIVHNTALASASSFSKNFFVIHKVPFGLGSEEVTDETMSKIGHDLISEIEDVVDAYARYMGDHGTSSLTTMGKNIKQMLETIEGNMKDNRVGRYTRRYGKTKMAVLRECVHGISKDIASIVSLSGALDKECGALSSLLSSLKNIEMEPATA